MSEMTVAADATPKDSEDDVTGRSVNQFALLEFEKPVTCQPQALVIASRLDADAYILDENNINEITFLIYDKNKHC